MFTRRETIWSPRPRRGMVAVLVAVLLPVVVGVMALALDGGLLYLQRRQAQSVADASALAGAYQFYNGNNFSVAQSSAIAMAGQNGYTIATSAVTTPQSGYVGVTVSAGQARFFSSLWGSGDVTVSATAVARGTTTPYSKAAILVLATSGTGMTLSGSASVTANSNIVVDSTATTAIVSSSTGTITTPELDLSGGVRYSQANPNNATVTKTGLASTADPLSGIAAPSSSGMTVQSSSAVSLTGSATRTLNPGVYSGGISLSGSSSLTLSPGIYYINGGGLNVTGSASISGSGVFIYNTGGGTINLSGTGDISLSPMSGGTYAGITIFQDRSNTSSATLSGGSNINNTGTFYFPSSSLTLSGGSGVGVLGAQFISKTIAFSGSSAINVSYTDTVAGNSSLALVE